MSDAPEKGATAPMNAHARPATQVSASAVPSTLESPQDASAPPEPRKLDVTVNDPSVLEEINGAAVVAQEVTVRDDSARAIALREAGMLEPASRRAGGPATLMSPAVAAMGAQRDDLPAGPAVVDVPEGELAHAFVGAHNSAHPGFLGQQGPGAHQAGHGQHAGPGYGHAGPGASGRSMSTSTLALIIGGAVIVLFGIGLLVTGFFLVRARRAAELASHTSAPAVPAVPVGAGGRPLMGGSKGRLTITSGGSLDAEAVRGAVSSAQTRIDSCFVNTEIEPPNHELAAYDLDVAASGVVTRAEASDKTNRCAKLDACMVQVLKSLRMPKSTTATPLKLTFAARINELPPTR